MASSALVLAIGATLLVTNSGVRAAPSSDPPATVEGYSVGRMRHIIILPEDPPAAPAAKPKRAVRPASPKPPVRSNTNPAQVPVQPFVDRTVGAGARGAVSPLPLQ